MKASFEKSTGRLEISNFQAAVNKAGEAIEAGTRHVIFGVEQVVPHMLDAEFSASLTPKIKSDIAAETAKIEASRELRST